MHAVVEIVSQRATFLWGVERRFTLEPEPAAITKLAEGVCPVCVAAAAESEL